MKKYMATNNNNDFRLTLDPVTGKKTSTPETVDPDIMRENARNLKTDTQPETIASQTSQGAKEEAKAGKTGQDQAPAPTPTPTGTQTPAPEEEPEPKELTSREEVLANFNKFMGREAESDEDKETIDYLTTLPPQEVEKRLKKSGEEAQIATIEQEQAQGQGGDTGTGETGMSEARKDALETIKRLREAGEIDPADSRFWEANPNMEENLQNLISGDLDLGDTESDEDKEKTIFEMIEEIRAQGETERDKLQADLETARNTLDEKQQDVVDSITETFNRRIEQQKQINKALLAGERVRGFTSGRARFASSLQANLISNQESAGLARISDLEAKKMAAISEAEMAIADKDFERMNEKMAAFNEAQDNQVDEIIKLNKLANENERLNLARMKDAREAARLGLSLDEAQRKEREFMIEQEDRIAGIAAINLINVDEEGNISRPSDEEIMAIAELEGISATTLTAELNNRIEEVEKTESDKRSDMLSNMKTLADIDRTQFLTQKDRALLPLTLQEKRLSIDKKIYDIAKSKADLSEIKAEDYGISQVEVVKDLQKYTNDLNTEKMTFDQVPDELKNLIEMNPDPNFPDKIVYRAKNMTSKQLDTIVQRRAESRRSQIRLEDSVAADLQADPSSENQDALSNTLQEQMGMTPGQSREYIKNIATRKKINIDIFDKTTEEIEETERLKGIMESEWGDFLN